MALLLDPVEVRVLGSLVEKEITTPEYYPLTLNALVNACNQKSGRDPVVSWEEEFVAEGLDTLREKKLVSVLTGGGNRVPKYGHRLQETLNLGRRETALLCELMLRGPQTAAELRDRAGRMYRFSDAEEVQTVLGKMQEHPTGALVTLLPRQTGQKEQRYAHLFSGEPEFRPAEQAVTPQRGGGLEARVVALEEEVRQLRQTVEELRRELGVS